MGKVIEKQDGTTSTVTKIRLTSGELDFLDDLEAFQRPGVKRRGTGPAVHRLIEHARGWDALLAGPLRAYLRRENMTVEEFAGLAELEANGVYDILTLATRRPHQDTIDKIRAVIGD